jgi:hypothetical protein
MKNLNLSHYEGTTLRRLQEYFEEDVTQTSTNSPKSSDIDDSKIQKDWNRSIRFAVIQHLQVFDMDFELLFDAIALILK